MENSATEGVVSVVTEDRCMKWTTESENYGSPGILNLDAVDSSSEDSQRSSISEAFSTTEVEHLDFSECGNRKISSVAEEFGEEVQSRKPDAFGELAPGVSTGWTDELHCLYLNLMEEIFVNDLYSEKYCAVDLCGRHPRQAASSQRTCLACNLSVPPTALKSSVQVSSQQVRSQEKAKRPHPRKFAPPSFSNFRLSPWIRHFRPRVSGSLSERLEFGGAGEHGDYGSLCVKDAGSENLKKHKEPLLEMPAVRKEVCSGQGYDRQRYTKRKLCYNTTNKGNWAKLKRKRKLVRLDLDVEHRIASAHCHNDYQLHYQQPSQQRKRRISLLSSSKNQWKPLKLESLARFSKLEATTFGETAEAYQVVPSSAEDDKQKHGISTCELTVSETKADTADSLSAKYVHKRKLDEQDICVSLIEKSKTENLRKPGDAMAIGPCKAAQATVKRVPSS